MPQYRAMCNRENTGGAIFVGQGISDDMRLPSFPCPVSLITAIPALKTAPGPIYRATIILAVAYWEAGCTGLPDDEVTQAALIRLPIPHWRPIKAEVLAAINQAKSDLDQAHATCVALYVHQSAHTAMMRERRAAKRAERLLGKSLAHQVKPMLPLPTLDNTPQENPAADMPAHMAARQRHATTVRDQAAAPADKPKPGTFTD